MNNVEAILAMSENERVLFRLRSFHRERVDQIQQNKLPVMFKDASRLVVHILPEQTVIAPKEFSASELKRTGETMHPFGGKGGGGYVDGRFNADGYMRYGGLEAVRNYTLLFRSGAYEGVMTEVAFQRNETIGLRHDWCEQAMVDALTEFVAFAKRIGLEMPVWFFAAMIGCNGARLCLDRMWGDHSKTTVDREIVWLPEVKAESFDIDAPKVLRRVCDVLWNSAGEERSLSFDEEGNWKLRR